MAQDRVQCLVPLKPVKDNRIPKDWESLDQLSDSKIFKTDLKVWSWFMVFYLNSVTVTAALI